MDLTSAKTAFEGFFNLILGSISGETRVIFLQYVIKHAKMRIDEERDKESQMDKKLTGAESMARKLLSADRKVDIMMIVGGGKLIRFYENPESRTKPYVATGNLRPVCELMAERGIIQINNNVGTSLHHVVYADDTYVYLSNKTFTKWGKSFRNLNMHRLEHLHAASEEWEKEKQSYTELVV